MYRIFILSLLAIVFSTFALEPSQVILRATEIRGDAMMLEWSAIDGAKTYKVLYDEESLINPKVPEPILESPSTDKTRIEIQKMMDGTGYYLVVQGFDDKGAKIGETLPLHASTLRAPVFALKDMKVVDDQHIITSFAYPIDIKNTQIEIVNTETKKARAIKDMTTSKDDLRIVDIYLEGKLAPGESHDLVLKKVTSTSGVQMSPESKKTFVVIFSSVEASQPADNVASDIKDVPTTGIPETDKEESNKTDAQADASLDELQNKTEELGIEEVKTSIPLESEEPEKTPVVIDRLPQTGTPLFLLLAIAIVLGGTLSYRKKTSL